ncbi:MAG: hypothetical protein F8N15_01410 [Methanobacterium sp.]|nr:hypothetical protein [Methanobacterium sp.]
MADRFDEMARASAFSLPLVNHGSGIAIRATADLLRQVAEDTRRQCAEVADQMADRMEAMVWQRAQENVAARCKAEAAVAIKMGIEALDLGTAPTVDQSSIVHDPVAAAAPEMLSALEGVLPYMAAAEKAGLVGHEGCHWPVEAVRAAIAKAKEVQHG